MIKQMFISLFAVTLMTAFSTITMAQDKAEQKKEMQEKSEQMKDMKMKGLKTVSCDPTCGFRVTSHDEAELIDIVKTHAKKMHGQDLTDDDVKGMMKEAGMRDMKRKEIQMKEEKKKDDGNGKN